MKILFMGTPDIAEYILSCLYENGENVVAVITQPDKPKGRGYTLTPPPVKVFAEEHNIPVYQPQSLRCDESQELIKNIGADIIIVVAYGKILPESIISHPKYGCINMHASLLPKYRGAAPIQRCIMNGEKITGVTSMYMDEGLDTGDILLQKKVQIPEDMNGQQLTEALSKAGAEIILDTIQRIKEGTITRTKQDDSESTYSPKIEKSELKIDFSKSAEEIHNLCRAVYPALAAYAYIETPKGKKQFKFAKTAKIDCDTTDKKHGEVIKCDAKSSQLYIACGKGAIAVYELIPEGKGKMASADYIRGRQISEGMILG